MTVAKKNTKHKNNKKYIKRNKNTKKYNSNKNKKGGADFFGGLIQVPDKKNYNVKLPGSRYAKMLNPNLYISSKTKNNKKNNKSNQSQQLKIIFNYRDVNQLDIANSPDNTTIDNTLTTQEPYIFINSYKYKFLIVMYRQIINIDKTYKNLLYWLAGYYHRNYTRIFPYIEPNVRPGERSNYIIKIYKCPDNDISNNFLKINNIDKAKAYEELNEYIKKYELYPITTINFTVKGNPNKGISLFNMVKTQPKQK
jgi:hypothetical protein